MRVRHDDDWPKGIFLEEVSSVVGDQLIGRKISPELANRRVTHTAGILFFARRNGFFANG